MNAFVDTLNVFRTYVISVFTYYDKPGAMFSREEQLGFLGGVVDEC